jgi:hypothetical protein
MGMDEVAFARARRAAARLERCLAMLEAGAHDLAPTQVDRLTAHIRFALEAHGQVSRGSTSGSAGAHQHRRANA